MIHFGSSNFSDYTKHNDEKRKTLYLKRHQAREDWTQSGVKTAGFWARWLLWNKKTLNASVDDIEKRFGLKIIRVGI